MNQEHLILEESAQCFSCASGVISVNVTLQASQGAQGRERTGHCTYSFSRSKTHQAQCCKASYTPGANQNKLSEHLTRSVGVCRAHLILPCVLPQGMKNSQQHPGTCSCSRDTGPCSITSSVMCRAGTRWPKAKLILKAVVALNHGTEVFYQ